MHTGIPVSAWLREPSRILDTAFLIMRDQGER
jgi:hypothetical protein